MEEDNWKYIVAAACIIISMLIYVFGTQYQVINLQTGQYLFAMKVNRITGNTWFLCYDAKNRWWEQVQSIDIVNKEIDGNIENPQ